MEHRPSKLVGKRIGRWLSVAAARCRFVSDVNRSAQERPGRENDARRGNFTGTAKRNADLNGNGAPDEADALNLLKYIVGIEAELG